MALSPKRKFLKSIFLFYQAYHFISITLSIILFCLAKLAHNVLAVYEGFLCPIRKMRSIFTGTKNFGGTKHHKGRKPDWCFVEPEPP